MGKPSVTLVREIAVVAHNHDLDAADLHGVVWMLWPGMNAPAIGAARDALEALAILRRLDDGTLDVATLLDEPCSNLDAAREAYVAQYEAQLDAACRALAGES